MSDRACGACQRPSPNSLCHHCVRALLRRLKSVDWLARELQTTLIRADQLGDPHHDGGHSAEKPLPLNLAASDANWVLANVLSTWSRALSTIVDNARTPRGFSSTQCAAWLRRYIAYLPRLPEAAQAADEIGDAIDLAMAVIDRREGRVFAGPCPRVDCAGGLFGRREDLQLRCRECAGIVDRADNDVSVHAELAARYYTAETMVLVVREVLGQTITTKRVHDLGYRRRNPVRSVVDLRRRKLYSAADVLAALHTPPRRVAAA